VSITGRAWSRRLASADDRTEKIYPPDAGRPDSCWAAAPAVDLRELVWVGAFAEHRSADGGASRSRRRWPIIHDEGDRAPSAADALQVEALTISEHSLEATHRVLRRETVIWMPGDGSPAKSGPLRYQHPGDRGDGIPVARRDRDPKQPVERAEVADDLHVAPVHAKDEPVVPREDFHQPLAAGRKAHGRRRRRARAFGQDAHEADDVGSHGLVREMILRHQPDNLATLADHDLGIKGKPAYQFGAELRPGDWPPDHEGARPADADGIEVLQLFGERGRSEGPVTADVDPSQKNHECQVFPPAGAARKLIHSAG
jgi:hypothetical protein